MKEKEGKFTGEYEIVGHAPVTQADLDLVRRANRRLSEEWVTTNEDAEEDKGEDKPKDKITASAIKDSQTVADSKRTH